MTSLLPENLQDISTLEIEKLMKEYFKVDPKSIMICTLYNVPDKVLPYVAEMFHCLGYEGYKEGDTKDQKIKIMSKSVYNHQHKGTVSAIKNIITASGLEVEPINYTEYEGRPHTYRLNIRYSETPVRNSNIESLLKQINEYKQLRAMPEMVIVIDNKVNTYYTDFAFCIGQIIEVDFSTSHPNL